MYSYANHWHPQTSVFKTEKCKSLFLLQWHSWQGKEFFFQFINHVGVHSVHIVFQEPQRKITAVVYRSGHYDSHNIKRSDWENSAAKMQFIRSVVDLLHQNPHWLSPIISSAYGVNLDSRLLDKILYVIDRNDMPWLLVQSVLSSLL